MQSCLVFGDELSSIFKQRNTINVSWKQNRSQWQNDSVDSMALVVICVFCACMAAPLSLFGSSTVWTELFSLHSRRSGVVLLFPQWLNCCISLIGHYICHTKAALTCACCLHLQIFNFFSKYFTNISLPFSLSSSSVFICLKMSRCLRLSFVTLCPSENRGMARKSRVILILSDLPLCWLWPKDSAPSPLLYHFCTGSSTKSLLL